MFSYDSAEKPVPQDHPLRQVRSLLVARRSQEHRQDCAPPKSKLHIQLSKNVRSHRKGERREGQLRFFQTITFQTTEKR
jgi:hypothetical protein